MGRIPPPPPFWGRCPWKISISASVPAAGLRWQQATEGAAAAPPAMWSEGRVGSWVTTADAQGTSRCMQGAVGGGGASSPMQAEFKFRASLSGPPENTSKKTPPEKLRTLHKRFRRERRDFGPAKHRFSSHAGRDKAKRSENGARPQTSAELLACCRLPPDEF